MAKIEKFFDGFQMINVTASVGEGGINLKEDVMVVQAMLKYCFEKHPFFRELAFPEPNGTMDNATGKLIRQYQRYLRKRAGESVSIDGLISRAVGDTAFGKRGKWTILCLNFDILAMRLYRGGTGNEYEELFRAYPELHSVLEIPVGSLNLSLESSGVGSLNLGLE